MKVTRKNTTLIELLNGQTFEITPSWQREYITKAPDRKALIDSVLSGIPTGPLYFFDDGDSLKVLDGSQRIRTLEDFYADVFPIKRDGHPLYFSGLSPEEQQVFLTFPVDTVLLSGSECERMSWFSALNHQGIPLSPMERRINLYHGPFLDGARNRFITGPPSGRELMYLSGDRRRGKHLETILRWYADSIGTDTDAFLSKHRRDSGPGPLPDYFEAVTTWVGRLFPYYREEMKKVDWGILYNRYKEIEADPEALEAEVHRLMCDEEVTKKAGIYPYLLTGDRKHLSLRDFSPETKQSIYEKQEGKCAWCGEEIPLSTAQADHILPWSKGGSTVSGNCQILCKRCNLLKSDSIEPGYAA